jgi:MurNAc alpha-1-phosphate uridylyltransferase
MTAPRLAMVLAAGRGMRMRPITETLPKPLIAVAGRTLLDRALDQLGAVGVEHAVVNTHHLAGQVEAHLAARASPTVETSHEEVLLDTGGGVANVLARFGTAPFYVVNSDALWTDGATPALLRLAAAWDDARMDALLLLIATGAATGHGGVGDYAIGEDGRLRARDGDSAPYVFAGVQIVHPRLFAGAAVEPFSLKRLYDRAEAQGRLFGLVHDGAWYHVGTPDALELAEARLSVEA